MLRLGRGRRRGAAATLVAGLTALSITFVGLGAGSAGAAPKSVGDKATTISNDLVEIEPAKVKGTFLNTASTTTKKGAKLSTKATGITRIALVASKGKGHGVVKVMLGKKTLKKVNLAQQRNVKKKVVPIARFSSPVSGKVTVQVVSQGKKVVIEGFGIATG